MYGVQNHITRQWVPICPSALDMLDRTGGIDKGVIHIEQNGLGSNICTEGYFHRWWLVFRREPSSHPQRLGGSRPSYVLVRRTDRGLL